jgi:hypothetical protein
MKRKSKKPYLNKRYKFKGWDSCEVGEAMGMKLCHNHDIDCDRANERAIKEELWNRCKEDSDVTWPNGEVKVCRKFLKVLIREEMHHGGAYHLSFYNGLLNTTDDFTFMQLFTHNLGLMWT